MKINLSTEALSDDQASRQAVVETRHRNNSVPREEARTRAVYGQEARERHFVDAALPSAVTVGSPVEAPQLAQKVSEEQLTRGPSA